MPPNFLHTCPPAGPGFPTARGHGELEVLMNLLGRQRASAGALRRAGIRGVATDSRSVGPGYCFIAVPGTRLDGGHFIREAVEKGATCLVVPRGNSASVETAWPASVRVVEVDDPRLTAGVLASLYHGSPSEQMNLIGVTGTNGKTTVCHLLESILREAGMNPGVIGTISQRFAGRERPAELTTPDPATLQALLAEMRDAGCDAVAMEVSSHALDQKRVAGCRYRVAAFTNLSHDHLDYHGDMERYFQAKARLFLEYAPAAAVVNTDCPWGERLWKLVRGEKLSCGLNEEALVRPLFFHTGLGGITGTVVTPSGNIAVESRLLGRHNLQNILTAAAAALCLGISPGHIEAGIRATARVPGRLDSVEAPEGITALVDYAHTPDALRHILEGLKSLGPRRLIAVVGCGGDRDRSKRPFMAGITASLADLAVFTSDNPRSEDPLAILDQMIEGIRPNGADIPGLKAEIRIIPDRREAILFAAAQAERGDCLVVAGKGHEAYQTVGNRRIEFDDRKVLKSAFASAAAGTAPAPSDSGFPLRAAELVEAAAAQIQYGDPETPFCSVSTDSRSISRGELFWALPGRRFDGENFVAEALGRGAAGAVVRCLRDEWRPSPGTPGTTPVILRVPDTLTALGEFAAWYRRRLDIKTVGITGSCGKTTTKEMVASVLGTRWRVAKTIGNFNNLIGLPLSILRAGTEDRWAVLEMGMNQPGEIARLCRIAAPQVGLITTIQAAHLEGVGSIQGVCREKGALWESLPDYGTAVVNLDDPLAVGLAEHLKCALVGYSTVEAGRHSPVPALRHLVTCLDWAPQGAGTRLTLQIPGGPVTVTLPFIGRHNVQNALAAAAVGVSLGITAEGIKEGLEQTSPMPGRLILQRLSGGWTLIDDTYNANPASMRAALDVLRHWRSGGSAAIFGDMFELGVEAPRFHRELGEAAAAAGVNTLIAAGRYARVVAEGALSAGLDPGRIHVFAGTEALVAWAGEQAGRCLSPPGTVLVKGSRAMGLERVVGVLEKVLDARAER